jgi:hypothetical protein
MTVANSIINQTRIAAYRLVTERAQAAAPIGINLSVFEPIDNPYPHLPAPSPLRKEGEPCSRFKPLLAQRGGVGVGIMVLN